MQNGKYANEEKQKYYFFHSFFKLNIANQSGIIYCMIKDDEWYADE
jgi:hypothetical protein